MPGGVPEPANRSAALQRDREFDGMRNNLANALTNKSGGVAEPRKSHRACLGLRPSLARHHAAAQVCRTGPLGNAA